MPEVWFFGLIFLLIFSLIWTIVEIGIKWFVLENVLVWKSVWLSLLSSVFIQLLQSLGVVLALTLSFQIVEKWEQWARFNNISQKFLLSIGIFLFFKFITDSTIGGLFLTVVKKYSALAWRASILSSFIGVFSLCTIIVLISNL